ncbi:uncharacterized protein LOC132563643 [Ylistrum balloti]|uniref:uncharacterized protein LOC132563643 n=1 Tax=Ylistrum balloti TaxID=509963 RepID=UPI002905C51B|nr:uncharacterized protein LOC132563643 [Ylistrum balloti]
MAGVHSKQNLLAWPTRWTFVLLSILMWLPLHHCMISSDTTCAGQQLSLTCTEGWLIHVIYETYSYSPMPCTINQDPGIITCTKAEFLSPVSVGHCNGQDSCLFTVPTNTIISSCNQIATALSVHYKCIPEASVFTICSDTTFEQTEQIYLATPDFPRNILGQQKNCTCTLIGQNINGTVLQLSRDPGSSVIMILSTDRGTQHINGLNILNTLIFSNLTKVNLFLENQLDKQVYKTWLQFQGKGLSLKCQYEKPYQPVTRPANVSVDPTISLVTNENHGDISLPTEQANINQTFSLEPNISVTPTQTINNLPNITNCSETKNSKCESDNTVFTISSSLLEVSSFGVRSTGVDLSSQIESTMQQVTMVTNEFPTESVTFTKSVSQIETVGIPLSATISIKSSKVTQHTGISTPTRHLVTNTPSAGTASSSLILNSNQSNSELQPTSPADKDVALLVIVGCLSFILLVAMVVFTVIMWRRANTHHDTQEETHIYDAYHHDNGSVGPEPTGDDFSYQSPANESILI